MKPLVSAIIPCYQAEKYLRNTLDSVSSQSYTNIEIIAVNDGSADGTGDIIDSYGSRIRRIDTSHVGAPDARNAGIKASRGEFLHFVDADDVLANDTTERLSDALVESGADAAYANWSKLCEMREGVFTREETIVRRIEDVDRDPEIAILTRFWCPPFAILYRRSLVERLGGFHSDYSPCEDARLMIDAAFSNAQFTHVDTIAGNYRIARSPSLSRRDPMRFLSCVFRNGDAAKERWLAEGELTGPRKKALLDVYGYAARSSYPRDRSFFDRCVSRLYAIDPAYCPEGPRHLRWISRLAGYPNAERIGTLFRAVKRGFGGHLDYGP